MLLADARHMHRDMGPRHGHRKTKMSLLGARESVVCVCVYKVLFVADSCTTFCGRSLYPGSLLVTPSGTGVWSCKQP